MSKNNKLIPELRFPEFEEEGEWVVQEVGEIFEVTRGQVLSMNLVKEKQNKEYLYPVFSSQTKDNGLAGFYNKFLYKDSITWTTDGANAGDVNHREGKFYCTNVCGVLINEEGFANKCIAELINSVSKNHVSYVGNPKLMNGVMSKIKIPIPSLTEQQKIASTLSSLDEIIEAENQKLDLLKEHKTGLMQNLFPQKGEKVPKLRFKEFEKDGEWIEKEIGEIAKVSTGGTPTSTNPDYWNGNIPWMNSGELNNKRIYSVSNYITSKGLKESSTKLIPPNCILIGLAGQGKTRGTAAINYIELCTNQSIGSIHPNEDVFHSEFLYQIIDSKYKELRYLSSGSGGRGGLNLQIIRNIKIRLPIIKEQQKIAFIFYNLDKMIQTQEEKIANLEEHKKGLMQGLFPKVKD